MAWQGIPFSLEQSNSIETVRLAFDAVPKIIIDAPPDYTNAIITGIVSLVAGIIPALIAVWTFKRNAENAKEEREKQQAFLIEDREKQQRSLEQDRETQLKVAEKNFNMQVLSGNRQSWINNIRDVIAEYTVEAPALVDATYKYKLKSEYLNKFHKHIDARDDYSSSEIFKVEYKVASEQLAAASDLMNFKSDKVALLSSKLQMMLNPREEEYIDILNIFSRIREINSELVAEDSDTEVYSKCFSEALGLINRLLILAQGILKREWERVKKGV